jgi:hypothetical protein
VLTEQTVQPQTENRIRLIELVGLNTNRDTFWKTLMGSCSNTMDSLQRIGNTSENSVMGHFSYTALKKEHQAATEHASPDGTILVWGNGTQCN